MIALAFGLIAAACGGDSTTTTAATSATGGETPATTSATTPPSTGNETTTTGADSDAATTTVVASGDVAIAVQKSDAMVEAAPDGWTVEVTNTLTSVEPIEQEVLFSPCLEAGSFDLNTLDTISLAAMNTLVTAPITAQSPLAATGSFEVRVFESESAAVEAYTVLEAVLGTTIGRECIGASSFALLEGQLPEGATAEYKVEELLLGTGDFGTTITWVIELEGTTFTAFLDMVAYRDGACTVFAVLNGFNEPFPTPVAVQMMDAAINA
jgi:hypothetical protein